MSFQDQEDDFYFDDCPVCQAQKKADEEGRSITMEELIRATLEAKDQGAIVGGAMFEDDW